MLSVLIARIYLPTNCIHSIFTQETPDDDAPLNPNISLWSLHIVLHTLSVELDNNKLCGLCWHNNDNNQQQRLGKKRL